MTYRFEKAVSEEIASIFSLYEKRVKWMDECGIRQWNTTDYLNVYPMDYYEQEIKLGNLFVLKSENRIIGAVVLLQHDERWPDKTDSWCTPHFFSETFSEITLSAPSRLNRDLTDGK